jgi:hypothetical protein
MPSPRPAFHFFRRCCLAVALLASALGAAAQGSLPDPLRFLATYNLFEKIRSTPGFDLTKAATFGYFFESKDSRAVDRVREALGKEGYVFVSDHVSGRGVTVLQLAKVEVHTVDSMVERNRALFTLASSLGDVAYTGWDITRNAQ